MKVLFSGGGTGGHINPGIAIAKYIKEKNPDADIRFIGTKKGLEYKLVPRAGFRLYTIDIRGLRRSFSPSGILYNIKTAAITAKAQADAKRILSEFRPDVVIGTGGYASFPAVSTAAKMKIPTAVLEVNAFPGVVTKMMAGKASKVMLSFEETKKYLNTNDNTVITGSPIRQDMLILKKDAAKRELGIGDRPLVVSFWGSLGASDMNKKMLRFFELSQEEKLFYHIHATGNVGYSAFMEEVRERNIKTENNIDIREYIYDMDKVMAASDIVICRAGASTLAELCALAKPCVIVPSPNVAENHQEKNARALEENGACVMFLEKDIDGDKLYSEIKKLLADREKLQSLSENARKMAKIDSVERIYDTVMDLIKTR